MHVAPTPESATKAAKRARYRRDVLSAAEALFAEHGVEGTKVEAIAAAAGIAPRTLYSVFPTKQALVHEVSERHRAALLELGGVAARGETKAWSGILGALAASARYYLGHADHLRHELREARFWADERASESGTWEAAYDGYTQLFIRAIAEGDVIGGEAQAWSRALLALQQSQLAHWIATDRAACHDEVVDTLLRLARRTFEVD